MNTERPLPADIGGYQHLEPDVICQEGDIYVDGGKPVGVVFFNLGTTVSFAETSSGLRIYRKMACPKQGGERPAVGEPVYVEQNGCLRKVAATPLPTDPKARKGVPVYSGFIKYFPLAIAAVARLSQVGNEQHNPGQPLHWDRSKSGDELDALGRHFLEAEDVDTDGVAHLTKMAWRSMAALQKRLEKEAGK